MSILKVLDKDCQISFQKGRMDLYSPELCVVHSSLWPLSQVLSFFMLHCARLVDEGLDSLLEPEFLSLVEWLMLFSRFKNPSKVSRPLKLDALFRKVCLVQRLPNLHIGAATFLESPNSASLPAIPSLPTGSRDSPLRVAGGPPPPHPPAAFPPSPNATPLIRAVDSKGTPMRLCL